MKPLTVFYLCDGLHPGGKERRLVEVLKHFSAGGEIRPILGLMSKEIRYPEVLALGIQIYYFIRESRHDLRIPWKMYRALRKEQPDLIHTWDPMTSLYASPEARLLRIPLVNGMITNAPPHIPWNSKLGLASRLTFPFSRVVVANSHAGLKAYRVSSRRGMCIHNGFDPKRISGGMEISKVRKSLGIVTPLVVGMVGEFVRKKDYGTYLAAAQRILESRRDVTFLAVGDGAERESLCHAIASQHRDRIIFTGWRERVEEVIAAMDVGVLATNAAIHGEGIPNAVLEYMALGKPVVATDAGGTNELIADGVTGFLVHDADPITMADRINCLLSDQDRARTMGVRGRNKIEREFSIELMVNQLRDLYRSVVQLT